jgi:single-strand DNA-binding protein
MAGLNKVMIIGRLGRNPEIMYTQQGLAIVNFPIATSEQWNDKVTGDKQEKTEWHRIKAFGKQAEILEKYLSKGRQVYIEGRLQTSNWEKDGQTHYTTEVIVNNFQFLGDKSDNQGGGYQGSQGSQGGYQSKSGPSQAQGNSSPNSNNFQGQTSPGQASQSQNGQGMTGGQDTIPDDDIPF